MKSSKKIFLVSSAICLVLLISIAIGQSRSKDDVLKSIDLFGETLSYIKSRYVEPVDDKRLFTGALHGLAENIDPESFYLEPAAYTEFKQMGGKLPVDMLGLHLIKVNRYLRAIAVTPDSPANKAGIKSGDYITHIEGQSGFELTLFEARKLLSGKPGSPVQIEVLDYISGEEKKHQLKRQKIIDYNVANYDIRSPSHPPICYIRINRFFLEDVKKMQELLNKAGNKKILLDLRNNYLGNSETLQVALDLFVEQGPLFLKKSGDKTQESKASPGKSDISYPLRILINESTTHYAELFVAVMLEKKLAITYGRKTRGLIGEQEAVPLKNGGAIYMTSVIYQVPSSSRKEIYLTGISPQTSFMPKDDGQKYVQIVGAGGKMEKIPDTLLAHTIDSIIGEAKKQNSD